MKDRSAARAPRDDKSRRDDDTCSDATWYEECARRPVDEPVIATIPLPDGK
jgi:hypothetical protein